jgi:P-type Ca2+ transporter type 2C
MENPIWHSISIEDTLHTLNSTQKGLSSEDAEERLTHFGKNKLKEQKKKSLVLVFLQQFNNFVVFILIAAAIISLAIWWFFGQEVEHLVDAGIILLIVIANAVLGFVQEYRAEKAMEALKKLSAAKAIVVRNGKQQEIDARDLVPGDIVLLKEGKRVPADCRIIESVNLRIDEASLTGESVPVAKHVKPLSEKLPLGDQKNMGFMNTLVSYGRGTAIITGTGMQTEFGKIAGLIQEIEQEETPLMKKLERLGSVLGKVVIVIAVLMFGAGFVTTNLEFVDLFLVSVSLAVAAIPEGLPAVVTITLALGMNVMAKNNAIVRRMSAVETLGSTSVICSDKTGTITKNEMTVTTMLVNGMEIAVTGDGYGLNGKLKQGKQEITAPSKELDTLLKTGVLCNDANIGKGSLKEIIGDPTEIALLFVGGKAGYFKEGMKENARFIREQPFDSDRKRMSVVYEMDGKKMVLCKGSVENLIDVCSSTAQNGKEKRLTESMKKELLAHNDGLAKQGLRVLGFAYKPLQNAQEKDVENDLVFLGMCGMIDTPREAVKGAIEICTQAGISVKMVTGDHKLTAMAIAQNIGLMKQGDQALTGAELDELNETQLEEQINGIAVFARVNPSHKVRIVRALERTGRVTAMTGDGVNDAPALKRADIGVAMGISGTDVSKEASDMIIADDNFATIVKAVGEGRRVYTNIKSFVKYLLSANTAEVFVVGAAIVLGPLGFPIPLVAAQILWINLVTDGLPALALGSEKADTDLMQDTPRPKNEQITDGLVKYILAAGVVGAIVTLAAFFIGLPESVEKARALAFTTLVVFELVWVFNCRSERKDVFSLPPWTNKPLVIAVISSFLLMLAVIYIPLFQPWFHTMPLTLGEWGLIGILSSSALFIPTVIHAIKK